MKLTQIQKLYVSNFLTGLVFWYGIEKLFMQSIGIDAVGVGTVAAVGAAASLLLEIPGGMLADKWSRKGTLLLSVFSLAVSSTILGLSQGLAQYVAGMLVYCVFLATSNGIYQAVIYDSLREEKRSQEYSKIMGRAYGLFLVGAGVANIASGFIGDAFGYETAYLLTLLSCVVNALVLVSLREPKLHRPEQKELLIKQLGKSVRNITHIRALRSLVVVFTALSIVELFKLDFGQLYILHYVTSPQIVGILWAFFAFMWAIGSVLAHRWRTRLTTLVLASTVPLIIIALVDHPVSLALFMVQIIASAALVNQIETRIQEETPSSVRASILSVLATIGRVIAIPVSFVIGWIIRDYGAFHAVQVIAVVAAATLIYWLLVEHRSPKLDVAILADPNIIV